jgi:hypothetical protein
MKRFRRYKTFILTTNKNGTLFPTGNNRFLCSPTGAVLHCWDGEIIAMRSATFPGKNNDGNTRQLVLEIRDFKNCTNVRLIDGGLTSIQGDFSDMSSLTDLTLNSNFNLQSLPNLPNTIINLSANNCDLLTVPTLPNTLQSLQLSSNRITSLPSLTGINLETLLLNSNALTSFPSLNLNPLTNFNISQNPIAGTPHLDFSAKSSGNMSALQANNCRLYNLTLPSVTTIQISIFTCNTNPNLSSINNLSNVHFPSSGTTFNAYNCSLNIVFPLGESPIGICSRNIRIDNNSMSQSNVDANINKLYTNRANFDTVAKTFNIGGNNADPSGNYVAPPTNGSTNSDWQYSGTLLSNVVLRFPTTTTVVLSGNHTALFPNTSTLAITGANTTGNNGTFTVSSSSYDSGNDETTITITSASFTTDATAGGSVGTKSMTDPLSYDPLTPKSKIHRLVNYYNWTITY